MDRLNSLAGILDFFIPAEVLSSVLLVFAMENILDHSFSIFIPSNLETVGWIAVYTIGVLAISILNYITAEKDELEDLNDDLDNI